MTIQIPIFHPQQTLSLAVFLQLRALLRQISLAQQDEVLFLSEASLPTRILLSPFTIVAAPAWVILLTASPCISTDGAGGSHAAELQVFLTFDVAVACQFVDTIAQRWRRQTRHLRTLRARLQALNLETSDAGKDTSLKAFQRFSEGLISLLSANDKIIEMTGQIQAEKEHLFHQVITQIRHSLELPEILETAAEQGRNFLQVDKLSIYCLVTDPVVAEKLDNVEMKPAYTAHAAYGQPALPPNPPAALQTLPTHSHDLINCQGETTILGDIQDVTDLPPCLRALFASHCPRALLATPITLPEGLWGLLVAQEYDHPRHWPESDVKFLKRIAEHVAIAIHQAHLYAQLRVQAQTLEQRVQESTQDLRDALLAAQAADRAKGEFLATMSHELRTPLACIIGMSSALLSWTTAPLTEKQREYLEIVHDSGGQLLELINDILELARLEAGKTVLNVSCFSVTQLARQVIESFQGKADSKNIKLQVELMFGSEEATLAADRRQIRRILVNLLGNAIKFTPEGGEVILRIWPEERSVNFQVEDTGIGISEEHQSLLFKKFQQVDMSYRRQYGGTGLGLALTKQLVELHKGWISVDSLIDSGSIFTVHIPAQPLPKNQPDSQEMTRQPEIPDDNRLRTSGGCVVIIEKDEVIAERMCDVLTTADYQVVWMVSGETAVHQIDLLQPVVVILALSTQIEVDVQLIQQLHRLPLTTEFKILLLALNDDLAYVQQCLDEGADDYLIKPFAIETLPQRLRNLLFPVLRE
ncbi:ATP-binding protein [Trichothermofontia sp.]